MTKSMDISDEAAEKFENVRRAIRGISISNEHPNNSEVLIILCCRMLYDIGFREEK